MSLRSTANAISNYSFDASSPTRAGGVGLSAMGGGGGGAIKLDLADGVATGNGTKGPTLEEKMSLLELNSRNNGAESDAALHINNLDNISRDDDSAIREIISVLQDVSTASTTERRTRMTQLIRMMRDGKTAVIQEHFRNILRLLIENLSDDVGATRALVFGVLTEMLKQERLIPSFQAFTELIILKVLEAHRDEEKDLERAAESCATAMASVLPTEIVVRVLNPIVKTGDFPVNQAAVKMMTKVADHAAQKHGENREFILANLHDIMPGLIKAYDNVESSMRKASVFCIVSLHQLAGEDLQPHLESLTGSKLKLLNLYIKRAQAQKEQSAPVSPRQPTPL